MRPGAHIGRLAPLMGPTSTYSVHTNCHGDCDPRYGRAVVAAAPASRSCILMSSSYREMVVSSPELPYSARVGGWSAEVSRGGGKEKVPPQKCVRQVFKVLFKFELTRNFSKPWYIQQSWKKASNTLAAATAVDRCVLLT